MNKEIFDTVLPKKMAELTCEIARTCNEKEQNFASMFHLTPTEFKCLRLFTNHHSLPIKEITTKTHLTPGRITHILTSLETQGFVKRECDPNDKRNVIVSLTSKSKPFIINLHKAHIKIHEEILQSIPEEKQQLVIDVMADVIRALKYWNKAVKGN